MANNTVTYWEIRTPDTTNKLIGWRWILRTQYFTVASDTIFTSKKNCKRSLIRFMTKHNFEYMDIEFKDKRRSNEEFLV